MCVCRDSSREAEDWKSAGQNIWCWQPRSGDRSWGGRGSCSHSSRYMCWGGADIEQEGSTRKHRRIPDDLVLLPIQSTS